MFAGTFLEEEVKKRLNGFAYKKIANGPSCGL
jgi:hypothetical protein